jgi:hypothetical protein
MKIIDTPIRWLAGRTAREVLLIGAGVAVTAVEARRPDLNLWHLTFYAGMTIAFAVRFFAARALWVATLVSALGLTLVHEWIGGVWTSPDLTWRLASFGAALLLLCSRDLRERFDRAESGTGWRTNRWRELPRLHWTLSCWLGYLLGLLANLILLPWRESGGLDATLWPLALMIPIYGCVLLLFMGRAIAFTVGAAIGGAAIALASSLPAGMWWTEVAAPARTFAIMLCGGLVIAVALPYAVYHVVRTLRAS